jgi:hypothetical protein
MTSERENGVLDGKAMSDIWRNTLSQIPTVLGRLFYLSSLRNNITGRYEHHGLSLHFGPREASLALRKSHREAFAEWLSYNVERQHADLQLFLSEQPEDKRTILKAWEKLEPYRNILPSAVKDVERKLFLSELKAILRLLRNASGGGGLDPES